jgi:hypothetical protein
MRTRVLTCLFLMFASGCLVTVEAQGVGGTGGDSQGGSGGEPGTGGAAETGGSGGDPGTGGAVETGGSSGTGGSGGSDVDAGPVEDGSVGGGTVADGSIADGSASDGSVADGPAADAGPPPAPFAVLTNRYDNNRTGANTQETILNTSNVKPGQFGLLFSRLYDGNPYAQPLYVPGLAIGGGTHNVVFVATSTNNVYAFDADDPTKDMPYWGKQVAPLGEVAIGGTAPRPNGWTWCKDMYPFSGVTGTPVIDPATKRMYLVTQEGKLGLPYTLKLHALDLATGDEVGGGPVAITAVANGTGAGSVGGKITMDSWRQFNRAGLTLYNGTLYVSMTSHCDESPYHGWFFAYDPGTLAQKSFFITTPNNKGGSIWQSGVGVAANDRGLFFSTSNGDWSASGSALGMSVVRLNLDNTLGDWFTPYNADSLNGSDADLTGSVVLIPNSSYMVSGGKEGVVYLIDQTNMTHYHSGADTITQRVALGKADIHDFVYYRDRVYVWPDGKPLYVFPFVNGRLDEASVQNYTGRTPPHPGGIMTISSNGNTNGSAVLWATIVTSGDAWHNIAQGALLALDAMNPSTLLWDSSVDPADKLGNLAKFSPPTVANGKVYVTTFANVNATSPSYLRVYGLKN